MAAWVILGFTLPASYNANDTFDVTAVASFAASALFIGVYSIAGIRGPAKWWRNNVGTYLVLAIAAQLVVVGIPAFAVIFNHGLINTRWWAWGWIGGHAASALMIAGLAWVYLRAELRRRNGGHG